MAEKNSPGNEEYQYTLKDITRYRPIGLANEFAESGDQGGLEKTLGSVLRNIEIKEEEIEDLSKTLNPENFMKVYSGKYQKALFSQKLRDLRKLYSGLFEELYTKENLAKVDELFDSNVTYEEFMEKYAKVGEIAKSKTDNFTKEQKEKAQKDLKELNKIAFPLQKFERLELDGLKGIINRESLGTELNSMYEEKLEDTE